MLKRRQFVRAAALLGAALAVDAAELARAAAVDYGVVGLPLPEVARLDWLCNAVALTNADQRLFVGLPRWPGYETTPSLGRYSPMAA